MGMGRNSAPILARLALPATIFALAACTAVIDGKQLPSGGSAGPGGMGASGNGSGAASGVTTTDACVKGASFAPARLLLISDDQYRNIVRDVFGVTFPVAVNVTTQPSTSGSYPYNESAQVQTTTVQAYQRAADQVAALLTSIPTDDKIRGDCARAVQGRTRSCNMTKHQLGFWIPVPLERTQSSCRFDLVNSSYER